jgi:hypothetical protein
VSKGSAQWTHAHGGEMKLSRLFHAESILLLPFSFPAFCRSCQARNLFIIQTLELHLFPRVTSDWCSCVIWSEQQIHADKAYLIFNIRYRNMIRKNHLKPRSYIFYRLTTLEVVQFRSWYGSEQPWPDLRYHSDICQDGLRKQRTAAVRTDCLRTEIWIGNLLNSKREY